MSLSRERIAIVGAGPIGLEAALFGVQAGFDVNVFERGSVAHNVFDWGHVRLFSPFGLNASEWGRQALVASGAGASLPAHDELLTGREFASRYLTRLSELPELEGRIHENTEVSSIGRSQTWKGDFVGNSSRADDCFQLLLRETVDESFREKTVFADYVFDCSGTYANHNWVGAGGMPCLGESSELTEADYRLPDVFGEARQHFTGKTTLVIGSGYSAATDVVSLARLVEMNEATRILWVTRSNRTPPMTVIENDELSERARLAEMANRLALSTDSPVQWLSGRLIHRIIRASDATGYIVRTSKVGDSSSVGSCGASSTSKSASPPTILNVLTVASMAFLPRSVSPLKKFLNASSSLRSASGYI